MNDELKEIKKIYGEEMAHLCRELFPTILEQPGKLLSILKKHLAPTHSLARDLDNKNYQDFFKDWIYSIYEEEKKEYFSNDKTPFELMEEAGYTLYECQSEEDIQSFKKYYAPNEVICTIYNGRRLDRCHVFFAVKKNADSIKREDFKNPKREDEYGTSVISIQFSKGRMQTLSIKNRYNHAVSNPDATFYNNLENIIPGLTKSFEKYYHYNINNMQGSTSDFLVNGLNYTMGEDGKYYRFNLEINGVYYCENNIIIKDGEIIDTYAKNPERYILIDRYIVDIKEKKISLLNDEEPVYFDFRTKSFRNIGMDSFIKTVYDVGKIKKINVTKDNQNKIINIVYDEDKVVKITIDKNNNIIEYENNYVEEIEDYFLYYNKLLRKISLNNAKIIKSHFLHANLQVTDISLPNVIEIGSYSLCYAELLKELSLPKVKIIGKAFLIANRVLSSLSMANVEKIYDVALESNEKLKELDLPKVKEVGHNFLRRNSMLSKVNLPNASLIRSGFLANIDSVESWSLPKDVICEDERLAAVVASIYGDNIHR